MGNYADKWATGRNGTLQELQYDHIRARLLVEEIVQPIPEDFKVVVCRGRCTVAWIDTQRTTHHRRNVYRISPDSTCLTRIEDCYWEYPPESKETALGGLTTPMIEEMCAVARKMAGSVALDLVRCDLYLINGAFHGGEVTLTSEAFMAHITEGCAAEALALGGENP